MTAELGRSVERALVELAGKEATAAQHVGRRVEQAAEDIEAVGTALERQIGLKVLDLMRQRAHDIGGDVGRVGDEYVKGAPLFAGNGAHQVCEAEGDLVGREAKRIAVFGSKVDGARLDIGSSAGNVPAALPRKGERNAARAAADLESAGSAGLGWGRYVGLGGILRGSRLLVVALNGDAVFVELGLGGFLGIGLGSCCLRSGLLGLAIGQLLGIGAATEHVATQSSLIGGRQVGGTALGGRAFVSQRRLGFAGLLDLIVPRQLHALAGR